MTLALRYAVRTDVGLLREGNEDSAYAGPQPARDRRWHGRPCRRRGRQLGGDFRPRRPGRPNFPRTRCSTRSPRAVAQANNKLHEMSVEDPSVEGMGTTLTALLWSRGTVAICHIGDSRAYLLRDGDFHQITRDHTLVQSLVDDGRLSPAQAATHPQRSLVMRALQSGTEAEPDLSTDRGQGRGQVPALLGRAVRRGQRRHPARTLIWCSPTARTRCSGSSTSRSAAAARTTSPASSPTSSTATQTRRPGRSPWWSARHRTATAGRGCAPTARRGAPTC